MREVSQIPQARLQYVSKSTLQNALQNSISTSDYNSSDLSQEPIDMSQDRYCFQQWTPGRSLQSLVAPTLTPSHRRPLMQLTSSSIRLGCSFNQDLAHISVQDHCNDASHGEAQNEAAPSTIPIIIPPPANVFSGKPQSTPPSCTNPIMLPPMNGLLSRGCQNEVASSTNSIVLPPLGELLSKHSHSCDPNPTPEIFLLSILQDTALFNRLYKKLDERSDHRHMTSIEQQDELVGNIWPDSLIRNTKQLLELFERGGRSSSKRQRNTSTEQKTFSSADWKRPHQKRPKTTLWYRLGELQSTELREDVKITALLRTLSSAYKLTNTEENGFMSWEEKNVVGQFREKSLLHFLDHSWSPDCPPMTYLHSLKSVAKVNTVRRVVIALHVNWVMENRERKTGPRVQNQDGHKTRRRWRDADYKDVWKQQRKEQNQTSDSNHGTQSPQSQEPDMALDHFKSVFKRIAPLGFKLQILVEELGSTAAVLLLFPLLGAEKGILRQTWNTESEDAKRALRHLSGLELRENCEAWGWEEPIQLALEALRREHESRIR